MIQQNASSSEEMASTSEELASQAQQLQQSIAFFKVDSNGYAKHDQKLVHFQSSAVVKNGQQPVYANGNGKHDEDDNEFELY